MEVPRFWREMPTNTSFSGKEKGTMNEGAVYFKYPGGEISLMGNCEQIYKRFEDKGFKAEVIERVLFNLLGVVASKPAISFEKIVNSQSELVGSEVRKHNGSKEKLRVNRLPRKITGKTLFPASTNN